jgi:hypothetical protein
LANFCDYSKIDFVLKLQKRAFPSNTVQAEVVDTALVDNKSILQGGKMDDACAVGDSVATQHIALLTIKGPTEYETVETPRCATTCAEKTLNAKRYYTV